MATLKDIAERTGLSIGAVSQILNASDARYAQSTIDRVRRVASEVNYVPNRAAQTLRTKESRTIGVIDFSSQQQLTSLRLYHLTQAIQQRAHRPLVCDISWFGQDGSEVCRLMIESRVRGVVLTNPPLPFSRGGLEELKQAGIPVVSVGGSCLKGIPKFLADKEDAFYQLTWHMLNLGYRRLVLSTGYSSARRDRRHEWHAVGACNGFNRAAAHWRREHGEVETRIDLTNERDQDDRQPVGGYYARGYRAMQGILAQRGRPDAVLCSNDSWALGAMTACLEQDVAVPDEIAITGMNDEPMAAYGPLPLTTVSNPIDQICERAVNRLFELLEVGGSDVPDERVVIRGRLIVRNSCGARYGRFSATSASLGDSVGTSAD